MLSMMHHHIANPKRRANWMLKKNALFSKNKGEIIVIDSVEFDVGGC